MKVVHLSTAASWRGGEQQCLYLMQGLAARGVDTLLLAPPGAPLLARAKEAGLAAAAFRRRGRLDPRAAWRLRGVLRASGADLVHAHDAHGVPVAALGGRLAGVRRVCTRRVDFPLRAAWIYGRGLDRVVCISHAVRRVCAQGGVPEDKLAVVHSGVDPDRLRGEYRTRALRESLGIPRKNHVLVNIASLTDHKGQTYLLEAMLTVVRDRPATDLLVAGTGELADALRRQARELALDERVHFLGFREDVGALLTLADLFVISSHLEGLCTSVLDAMAMERAVVVTDAGGLPEIVRDEVDGRVVPAKDPEALAAAILELLADRRARERMGRAGRERVREAFTVDRMVEGTLAQYRELCGG